jgi:hypothetical protein
MYADSHASLPEIDVAAFAALLEPHPDRPRR